MKIIEIVDFWLKIKKQIILRFKYFHMPLKNGKMLLHAKEPV